MRLTIPSKLVLLVVAMGLVAAAVAQFLGAIRPWTALVLLVVALGVGWLIALVIARQLTGPIHRLAQAARRLGQGYLSTKVDVTRWDELGDLTRTFNMMAIAVKRLVSDEQRRAAIAEGARHQQAVELDKVRQELQRTQAMLVQTERMGPGKLAGGIAHELKNPLNIIMQSISYLEGEPAPDRERLTEILGIMRDAIKRADTIIQGLLRFSRPAPLALKPGAIGPVMEVACELVQRQLGADQIRVTKDIAPALPLVMLDEDQMKQVFINLTLNAFQAMPNQGALALRAYVKALTRTDFGIGRRATDCFHLGDTAVICEVEDTGPGIPKAVLAEVFNPFFTTKGSGEGTGLGLSIARTIVEGHRGVISLRSPEGQGTTAVVTLPIPNGEPAIANADHTHQHALET